MKSDIEIASSVELENIINVAKKINLTQKDLELYGNYKAKVNASLKNNTGKLILVTSINPTPYGEGKTTVSIGINDALRKLNKNSIAVLREPSLGPVFGIKGGATGGGYSQVIPMEDINLHFTGDLHAITSCNNLLCSIIDNHIFQGNELNIDPDKICFKRCLDINDRSLREIKLSNRLEHFNITAASEIMSIFCLANNFEDLKKRLGNILIGYTYDDMPIFADKLKCTDSLAILLKDAINPNLVQSLEHNPVLIHGGPFANIAHGCNSLIATKLGLSLCDFVVTEAGFGSDLGAEKFFDIKCRNNLSPNVIVINVTIKALKYNGYCPKEAIEKSNLDYLKKGIINLDTHIENMKKFGKNIIVCLNKYNNDTKEEIMYVKEFVENKKVEFSICECFEKGSNGATDIARKIIKLCNRDNNFHFLYNLDDKIETKIIKICTEIYRASNVIFTNQAKSSIQKIKNLGYSNLPICIAKTQYSLGNNKDILGKPKNYSITVDKIDLFSGAGFIVIYLGNIMTMPGLPKKPNALNMTIDDTKKINGLF